MKCSKEAKSNQAVSRDKETESNEKTLLQKEKDQTSISVIPLGKRQNITEFV